MCGPRHICRRTVRHQVPAAVRELFELVRKSGPPQLAVESGGLREAVASAQTFSQRAEQAGIAALSVDRLAQQWLCFGRAIAQQQDLSECRRQHRVANPFVPQLRAEGLGEQQMPGGEVLVGDEHATLVGGHVAGGRSIRREGKGKIIV